MKVYYYNDIINNLFLRSILITSNEYACQQFISKRNICVSLNYNTFKNICSLNIFKIFLKKTLEETSNESDSVIKIFNSLNILIGKDIIKYIFSCDELKSVTDTIKIIPYLITWKNISRKILVTYLHKSISWLVDRKIMYITIVVLFNLLTSYDNINIIIKDAIDLIIKNNLDVRFFLTIKKKVFNIALEYLLSIYPNFWM